MNMSREQLVAVCADDPDPGQRRKAASALYLAGWVDGRQASDNDAATGIRPATGQAVARGRLKPVVELRPADIQPDPDKVE